MKIAWHPCYAHPLPENHRFPMEKYNLLKEQLLYEGTAEDCDFVEPKIMTNAMLELTHDHDYIRSLENNGLDRLAQRKTGFPWSNALVKREKIIMQGTWDCTQAALEDQIAMNIAGGTHHAYANAGEGFCLFNDFAISANLLLHHQWAKRILILDLDVHQGNGTAKIFENNDRVFCFSMHGQNNYPSPKEKSDWDIGLADGCEDQDYLNILSDSLEVLGKKDFDFMFYQCGVDILRCDKLGKLNISLNACKQRDQMVFDFAKTHNIPTVCAMGGGYSPSIRNIVEAHTNTFRLAKKILALD